MLKSSSFIGWILAVAGNRTGKTIAAEANNGTYDVRVISSMGADCNTRALYIYDGILGKRFYFVA